MKKILFVIFIALQLQQLSSQTYTFTSCGAIGNVGPTQLQVNNTYTGGNLLAGAVLVYTPGIQSWTVPATGVYSISVSGARGGNNSNFAGGLGYKMDGSFYLLAGTVLNALVGQPALDGTTCSSGGNLSCGGGGASYLSAGGQLLLVGAGGQGAGDSNNGVNAASYPSSFSGPGTGGTSCGSNGYIGYTNSAGGGFFTRGQPLSYHQQGGDSYVNGGGGGITSNTISNGGFGGGGAGVLCASYGGGGGGFTGGSVSCTTAALGGARSYISPLALFSSSAISTWASTSQIIVTYINQFQNPVPAGGIPSAISQFFTAGTGTFTVPPCVNTLTLTCYGAQGAVISGLSTIARGGMASGVTSATPGTVYHVYVGSSGTNGGANGGGGSGMSLPSNFHRGGGASDIRFGGITLNDRIIVAGGGGGVGNPAPNCTLVSTSQGGGAGSVVATNCVGGGGSMGNVCGNIGGSSGGIGGVSSTGGGGGGGGFLSGGGGGQAGVYFASGGSIGLGGVGSAALNVPVGCGGGGYYGGGGGSASINSSSSNGGGGSSWTGNLSSPVFAAATRTGDGLVVISYTVGRFTPSFNASSTYFCAGGGNTVSISAAGPVSYSWSANNTFVSSNSVIVVSPSVTTSYFLSGVDALGCLSNHAYRIYVNPQPTVSLGSALFSLNNNFGKCAESSFTLTPFGAATYTYSSGSAIVNPTTTTTYTILGGTSAAGCISSTLSSHQARATVSMIPSPIVSLSNPTLCTPGAAVINLNPIGAIFYYYVGGSNYYTHPSPTVTTTYSLYGISLDGCRSTNTAVSTVVVGITPTVSVNSGTMCSPGVFTISPSGAATYTNSWGFGTSNTVNPTSNTTITVVGTSSTGCVSANTASCFITVYQSPYISVGGGNICSGKSFTINPTGAQNYTFSGGSNVVSPTINASYTVAGTNSLGCLNYNTAISNVYVYTTPTISVNSGTLCTGKIFTITPNGASTYTLSSGTSTVSPLTNTFYTVVGTSTAGCVSSNTAISTLTVFTTPTLALNSGSICSGSSFTLNPTGNFNTYTIIGGNTIVSPTATTNYTVAGTSSAGCVSSNTPVSTVSVYITPTISANSGTLCSGKSFTIQRFGASQYQYSGGSQVVSPSVTTTYSISGNNTQGCVSINTAVITVSVYVTPTITVPSGSICSGNSFSISPAGASNYSYSGGSSLVSPLTSTLYLVTGYSAQGCTNTAVSSVTVYQSPTITVNSGSLCSGKSFTINPLGAPNMTISGGSNVVNPVTTTSYSVTGTGTSGCASANTAVSTVTVHITPTITVNNGIICSGKLFTINPSGANTYTISSGANIVSPPTNTSYSVTGSSSAGCVALNTAVCNVTVNITPTVTVNNGSICAGNSFTIIPNGAFTYSYSSGSNIVSPLSNTLYYITGLSTDGCVSSNTAICAVNVLNLPLPNLTTQTSNTLLCLGEPVVITASGALQYYWSTGSSFNTITLYPTVNTTYSVTGSDANGCTKMIAINVIVNTCNAITANKTKEMLFNIYPNPNTGEFIIETLVGTDVTIVNALGQLILQQHLVPGKNKIEMNGQANGIYFVLFTGNQKSLKVVKQ